MTDDNPMRCERCGQPHAQCAAHTRRGKPCGGRPVKGARVCRMHGGAAAQVQAAAARRLAEDKAREVLLGFGVQVDTDPHTQLARLINTSAGLVSFYEYQCRKLHPDALVWGDVEVRDDFRGLTVVQRGEISVWLRLYNEERDRLGRLCRDAIASGLAEREVRLAEQQGALVAEVLRLVLADLELTPDQQTRALNVVPLRLREYGALTEGDTTVVPLPKGRG